MRYFQDHGLARSISECIKNCEFRHDDVIESSTYPKEMK